MAPEEPRKRLTERVADRKAGRSTGPDRTPKQLYIRNRLELFGTVLAMFGLFMLAYSVFQSDGETSWANEDFIMYCTIFVIGRAVKASADAMSRMF